MSISFKIAVFFRNQSILYKVGMKKKQYVIIDVVEYVFGLSVIPTQTGTTE